MSSQLQTRGRSLAVTLLLSALVWPMAAGARHGAGDAPRTQAPPAVLDVVAVDRNGAAVDDLGPGDFLVTADGVRLPVTAVRYVSRGPGALNDTQTLSVARGVSGRFAAELGRTVVLVIDQTTLLRGDEKAATAAVRRVIDQLGLDDRIGIVRLPLDSGASLTLDTDRPSLVASLRGVMGQMSIASLASPPDPFALPDTDRLTVLNPEKAGSTDRTAAVEQERVAGSRPVDAAAQRGQMNRGNLADLQALFTSLRAVPGRKAVILFSAGLTGSTGAGEGQMEAGPERVETAPVGPAIGSLADAAGLAATQAHVVVQAFGLKSSSLAGVAPDVKALEALARATGGQFAPLGRNADQAVARVLADLSSCYVLSVDGASVPRAQRRVKVSAARAGVTVRAPAWLTAHADAADFVPPVVTPAAAAGASSRPQPREDAASAAKQAELRRLLARVADYVEAYQREYSSVVAEEDFEQTDFSPYALTKTLRLKSDLLLIRPDPTAAWVSFRDVYEVDGKPVRERDARLQRLFLDPTVENRARLDAIKADSARYNLGPVRRTDNAPLFPLTFLARASQPRFLITLKDSKDLEGLKVAEIGFQETSSPTIAAAADGTDQPVAGRFLVDPVSGAVVESRSVYARAGAGQVEYIVRYRRDETLGLWVPAEMREAFNPKNRVMTLGVARYQNFRRFQVTTDTKVTVPK